MTSLQDLSADRVGTGVPPVPHQAGWSAGSPVRTGIACAGIALLVALAAGLLDRSRPLTFGHDLLPSYVAGRLVTGGRADQMYVAAACEQVGRAVMADANLTGDARHVRWLNPAFFSLPFAPLALLPYRLALLAWLTLNAALAGGALHAVARWVPGGRRRLLFLAAVVTSCPLLLALQHQQNTFLSLALLAAAARAWRGGRPLTAGLLVGLLAYKPQVAAVVGLALVISDGRRALVGVLASGAALLLAGELLSPGSTVRFLTDVPRVVAAAHGSPGFNWGRQVTPTSFWRSLLGGPGTPASVLGYGTSLIVACVVAAFARAQWRGNAGPERPSTDAVLAAAVIALPLAAPYFMDYDLLLLAVPAALALAAGRPPVCLLVAWALLWPAAYLNVDAVDAAGVGVVAPLLGGLLAGTWAIARLGRRGRSDTMPAGEASACPPLPRRAA